MDFIKKAGESLKGSSSGQQAGGNAAAPQQGGAAPAQTQDYGDKGMFFSLSSSHLRSFIWQRLALFSKKPNANHLIAAFDFASKKSGHDFAPGTDEKITDGARGLYEKATGYVFFPPFSSILLLASFLPPPAKSPTNKPHRSKVDSKYSN